MARSTIDEIRIENFKFFPKMEKPIKIDGKHLLLYGENGSGKSSIYWALYTLLECALKEKDSEIEKYFQHNHDQRLTNIHLQQGSPEWVDPIIAIKLKDGTEYKVSLNDKGINKDEEAKKNNLASDFIHYRMLFRLYNFAHSETIDLFSLFLYDILPYLKFNSITYWRKNDNEAIDSAFETASANLIWEFVKKGPQKNILNSKKKKRFPLKREDQFKDYQAVVNSFKNDLNELITYINTQGNPILKDQLGYNIIFRLELKETPFSLSQQSFVPPKYEVILRIPDYEGVINGVKRPHSFLNEAKLTAIALAIRLSILQKRLAEANLRILVLDDLLISLDMSNREKVIDLILNNYIKNYQVLILTHDRIMFEDTLRHIELFHRTEAKKAGVTDVVALNQTTYENWCVFEMYQALDKNNIPKPFIVESLSNIQKALYYFKEQVDYNACGNNLRAALEDFFIEFIPYSYRDGQTMLMGLIARARLYFDYIGFDSSPLDKIDRYIKRSLNPTSHYNPKANYYRKELEDIFSIYFKIRILKSKPLISINEKLKFSINTLSGNIYIYTVQLLDDIRFYNANENAGNYLLPTDKQAYILIESTKNRTELTPLGHQTSNLTLQELYDETVAGLKTYFREDAIVMNNMNIVFMDMNDITLDELSRNAN